MINMVFTLKFHGEDLTVRIKIYIIYILFEAKYVNKHAHIYAYNIYLP